MSSAYKLYSTVMFASNFKPIDRHIRMFRNVCSQSKNIFADIIVKTNCSLSPLRVISFGVKDNRTHR